MQTQNYPKQQPENGKFITFNGILLEFLLLKKRDQMALGHGTPDMDRDAM